MLAKFYLTADKAA